MSAESRNRKEGSGGRRLYKLVGGVVVALVLAAVLIPLWLGDSEKQQSQLVEVQPETLSEADGQDLGQEDEQKAAEPKGEDASGKSGGKWWQEGGSEPESERAQKPAEAQGRREPEPEPEPEPEEASPSPSSEASAEPEPATEPESEKEASISADTEEGPVASKEELPATEAEPAAATAEKPPEEPQGAYWTVMVGSFQDADNAEGLRAELEGKGLSAHVVKRTIEGRDWRRVYAGRQGSREEAVKVRERLRGMGYNDLLVLRSE